MKTYKTLIAIVGLLLLTLCSPAFAQSTGANVAGVAINRSTVNASVTITTGNTFQTVLASNFGTSTQRQALTIQNNNAADSCWITFGVLSGTKITAANAAKASSILLTAGGSYTRYWPYVPSDEIEATCASNSDTLYIEVQ